jgi:hypothetical protein
MNSSTSPQYTSNPSLTNNYQIYDEEPTSSSLSPFRHKLQHTKSHTELYQPNTSLSFSPKNNENGIKHSSDSPESRTRTTTTVVSSSTVTQSSRARKIPLWKRFKKMIVPKKRKNPSSKIPTLFLDELSENEPSKNYSQMT